MTTKITKWGNSYGLRIPKKIIEELHFEEGEEFEFSVTDQTLKFKPKEKKAKYSLKQLCAQIENVPHPVNWGPDVGKEILEPYNSKKI